MSRLAALLVVLTAAAPAALAQPPRHDEALRQRVEDAVADRADQRERDLHRLVEDGLRRGGWKVPPGSRPVYLSLREAALLALRQGLTASSGRLAPDIAEAVLQEAMAVFDPVINLSVVYEQTDTFRRAMEATVRRKAFLPYAPTGYMCVETGLSPSWYGDTEKCPKDSSRTSPAVIALGYLQQDSGVEIREIEASSATLNNTDANHSFTYTVTLSQTLPWGADVSLTHQTYQKRIYYRDNKYWADADITANLSASFSAPLPFTKGFGPNAARDAAVRQERIARSAAEWLVQDTLNQVLLAVDDAWWSLVARLEELQVYRQNLQRVEQRAERTARLYARELSTELDRSQVQAELARARSQWEEAQRAYLAASHALGVLIEPDAQALLRQVWVPSGYVPLFREWPDTTAEQAWETARELRPDLHVEVARREIAAIDVDVADNETRPDLAFSAWAQLKENHDNYAYSDVFTATEKLTSPDEINLSASLSYTYQIGNRAARARLAQKQLALTDQTHAVASAEDLARREIRDALDLLATGRDRAAASRAEVAALRDAVQRLRHLRETIGETSEIDLIQAMRRLQTAQLNQVAAVTGAKRAEGRLLAAQGLLPGRYGERAAVTAFERERVGLLAKSGLLGRLMPSGEARP